MFAAFVMAATISVGTCDFAAAQRVVADVNGHRTRARELPLVVDPRLTAVALERAADLLRRHYFAHVSPDGSTALDALRDHDFRFAYAGENLASAGSVEAAELGLWASPDHRENILGRHYRHIGIAVLRTTGDESVVVQIFTD
jgi:uncharacterized protein YkwD